MRLSEIATLTGVSISHVSFVCKMRKACNFNTNNFSPFMSEKAVARARAFRVSPNASKSLADRAILLHRRFPEIRISASTIQKLYKRHGIKRKVIRKYLYISPIQSEGNQENTIRLKEQVQAAMVSELSILYLDEFMFTSKSEMKLAYSGRYSNISVCEKASTICLIALLAAISAEDGLEYYMTFEKSVNTDKYINFLEALSMHKNREPFAIFLDNLSVHCSKRSIEAYQVLTITTIFNIPYNPQNNPIETYFSVVKRRFTALKLESLVKLEAVNTQLMIREKFEWSTK